MAFRHQREARLRAFDEQRSEAALRDEQISEAIPKEELSAAATDEFTFNMNGRTYTIEDMNRFNEWNARHDTRQYSDTTTEPPKIGIGSKVRLTNFDGVKGVVQQMCSQTRQEGGRTYWGILLEDSYVGNKNIAESEEYLVLID